MSQNSVSPTHTEKQHRKEATWKHVISSVDGVEFGSVELSKCSTVDWVCSWVHAETIEVKEWEGTSTLE